MKARFESRHLRSTALGIALCLLSALFAVEAKIAWFSPAGSGCAQFSAAKARPAEQPKLLPERLTSPESSTHDFAIHPIVLVSLIVPGAFASAILATRAQKPAALASPAFSAALFFRPPPSL